MSQAPREARGQGKWPRCLSLWFGKRGPLAEALLEVTPADWRSWSRSGPRLPTPAGSQVADVGTSS